MLTFEGVRLWINAFEENGYLSESLSRLVGHLWTAWERRAIADVLHYIDLLQQLDASFRTMHVFEHAEIHLECGHIYYEMGDYPRAGTEIQRATELYRGGHPHNLAVANWLLGCVFWQRSAQSSAIARWERSRRLFGEISKRTQNTNWYQERIEQMSETLNYAIDEGRWPYN